jgi:type I restriction-modification system DNA methylase subunit/predicted type IV restriction endonuclease
MSPPQTVLDLVEHFRRNADDLRSHRYNETALRREFLDPFFEALGWDVNNNLRYAETYKDVVHEPTRETDQGIPDYCFRVGGAPKFYLEAKKPSVRLKDNPEPALQLRRYAWSSKLPLSVLSNFDELAIYDCRTAPKQGDKASTGRISYYTFEEYPQKWQEIASRFSKEAVLQGSFDRFAVSSKAKRGTTEVDAAFLAEIEAWRHDLAATIAVRNPNLGQREVNFAVQRTIDRIIFLRICEDRGLESYGQLRALTEKPGIYAQLCDLFQLADRRYNSGLFHFHQERERNEVPDALTPTIAVDDARLKPILKKLYYPESPYAFSHVPADILGHVYEQFLGSAIRITPARQVKVELKPEVKKAGGVYYTPTYIVDYIVKNTVGRLLDGESPKQVTTLRVLDPACGSGSFLIGAYQFLLNWYRDRYVEEGPQKHKNEIVPDAVGNWRLSLSEKKKILTRHIYGVDIDSQAVEVTKLSLLLKVLEGETQLRLFHERALPDLGSNIKCGNSLIGPDFYENQQMLLLDEEDRYRVNVFDWKQGFSDAMKSGGFDAVIGNPPYVDIKGMPAPEAEYIFRRFAFSNNRINFFAAFIEKSLQVAKKGQFRLSVIVPTALLTQDSYQALRRRIVESFRIRNVVRVPNESFGSAAGEVKVDTAVIVIGQASEDREPISVIAYSGYDRITEINPATAQVFNAVPQETWAENEDCVWTLDSDGSERAILRKCECNSIFLEETAEFCLGLTPYDKYKGHTRKQIADQVFHADHRKDPTFRKLLAGNDVRRYSVAWNGERWISYGPWLGAPREERFFTQKRILVKQIIDWTSKRIWATIAEEELFNTQNAFNLLPRPGWKHEYLLGIINSRLMTFYHRKKFLDEFKMRFQKILIKDCRRLPVHLIASGSKKEADAQDRIVNAVKTMISLQSRLRLVQTDQERTVFGRQIEATDRQIDKLVYELYGLTQEEISIVESPVRG